MPTLAVITTPHWDDLVALGALIVVVFALCHLARRLIDLTIAAMQQAWHRLMRQPELLDEYADFNHDPADDTEALADSLRESHSWPNMAPLLAAPDDPFPAPAEPAGYPDLDEDQHPTDPAGKHAPAQGRVSVDQVTGYVKLTAVIPAPIEDTAAMQAVAAVSGQDGAT